MTENYTAMAVLPLELVGFGFLMHFLWPIKKVIIAESNPPLATMQLAIPTQT